MIDSTDGDIRLGTLPTMVELELTSACNANCLFCPRHLAVKPGFMSRTTLERSCDRIVESGIKNVKLAGFGEPTLHPDFLQHLQFIRSKGLRPHLNTNGIRLNRFDMSRLLSLCDGIIISIHSLDPGIHQQLTGTNTFQRVKRNLDKLIQLSRDAECKITLYVVVTQSNQGQIYLLSRYQDQVTLKLSGCSNRIDDGFADDIISLDLNERYNAFPPVSDENPTCHYAAAAVVIDFQGRYLLCTNDMGKKSADRDVTQCTILESHRRFMKTFDSTSPPVVCLSCENTVLYRQKLAARKRSFSE